MVHILYTTFNNQSFDEVCYATRLHWLLSTSADDLVERLYDAVHPRAMAVVTTYVCRRLLIDNPTLVFGSEANLLPVMVCVVGSESVIYVDLPKLYQFIARCRRVHMLCRSADLRINGSDVVKHPATSSNYRDLESLLRRVRPTGTISGAVTLTCDDKDSVLVDPVRSVLKALNANVGVVNLLWYFIFALEGACGSLKRRLPCGVLTVFRPSSMADGGGVCGGTPTATLKRKPVDLSNGLERREQKQ